MHAPAAAQKSTPPLLKAIATTTITTTNHTSNSTTTATIHHDKTPHNKHRLFVTNKLKTNRKTKVQAPIPAPINTLVDSNEITIATNDTTTATIFIHDTSHEDQNTIKTNPTIDNTAFLAPKIPFQVAPHLKFTSYTTVQKFKSKAKTGRLRAAAQPVTSKISTYFYALKLRTKNINFIEIST